MFNKLDPKIYNPLALFLTCAVGSIVGALVFQFTKDNVLPLTIASLVGYGFGRFFMPLK